ncbi:zinc ABC transporter substrate-binding protein [Actinotalea ferrariae]|nr:zinc ABC transporter substrate-binding protein [Actinotalea ferrariae]
MSTRRAAAAVACALLLPAGLAACAPSPADDGSVAVLASFYPLQYVAEQVGGDHVSVSALTPPGAEPHDLELSPRQVRSVGEADVVVVLGGFQPAVDEAVAAREPAHVVDAARTPAVAEHRAEHGGTAEDHGADDHAEAAEPEHEHDEAAEQGEEGDGHDHEGGDPHFWLDPTLLAAVAADVASVLGEADPDHADVFTANAAALAEELDALDAELAAGLATCEQRVVVTSHEAFGYLAERYGFEQVGISGLDPEAEPSPARLREIRTVVEEHGVTTIFTEQLLNPKVAETLAADLGIGTAVLDPLESQADEDSDYRDVMERNLEALREALRCA